MLSLKHIKSLLAFAAVAVGIYYSPHFFSRFCISEGSLLSNEAIIKQSAEWLIKREYPNALLKPGGMFGEYSLVEQGKVLTTFEVGKLELWSPLKPDYPNYVYVYAGSNYLFIFDACENLITIRS